MDPKCEVCHGKQSIRGSDNLIKFFSYVLDFKLGNRRSYNSDKFVFAKVDRGKLERSKRCENPQTDMRKLFDSFS